MSVNAYSVGDIIEFGSYPQSEVKNEALISALNSQSGKWKSYGYYSDPGELFTEGKMSVADYMRYMDVEYNGNKYRAVTFDSYRPYTIQDDNSYKTGTTYWFRYEPLKWRILDLSTGLVMCNTIIDSQAYNNYIIKNGAYWGDKFQTYYASNYSKSSIRLWLNNDFYNTAFSDEQKSNIKTTMLNKDSYLTLTGSAEYSKETGKEYDSPSTNDKVFLLSYDQVINSRYGFASDAGYADTARIFRGSDYAKCQGLYIYSEKNNVNNGNSWWWQRTPESDSGYACAVGYRGNAHSSYYVTNPGGGVVPALCLKKFNSEANSNPIISFFLTGIQWLKNLFSSIVNIFKIQ